MTSVADIGAPTKSQKITREFAEVMEFMGDLAAGFRDADFLIFRVRA